MRAVGKPFESLRVSMRLSVRAHKVGCSWRLALGGLASAALLLAFAAAPAGAVTDYSGGAFQILAPGEEGGLPPNEFSTDQGKLYNKLTRLRGDVTARALKRNYVSEKFTEPGQEGETLEFTPLPGLQIWRDKYDIPHIFGASRAEVMYGSGWVAAQDRGLLLRLGLGPAYAAALSIPGINAFELLLSGRSFTPSAQAVKFVEEQKNVLLEAGPEGKQVIEDLENWAEGINAYEETLPEDVRLSHVGLADAIAGFAFIGSIFGNGGGQEVADSNFLAALEKKLGSSEGEKVFRDLREVNDPEAPVTTTTPFPYDQEPTGPTPGALVVDPGSMSASAVKATQVARASRRKASNFLVVGAANTKAGHPLAVMGPQLGYFYPEIVMQGELQGGGIDAEGIIAPISPYVFIGRGSDFAWSLTSAESENIQQFLLKLCNPEGPVTRESEYYEYEGKCIKMSTFDAGTLAAAGGEPEHEVSFKESVYGPVSGTVTVKGAPYAIANDRSTRGREPAGELAFSALDSNKVHNPEQFFEAANKLETTFNMSYLDSKNIAYFSTGRLPILAPGTNPSLPTLGNGEYNWRGFLSLEQHPHTVDPAGDLLLNWNTKPAPEWGAASSNFDDGPVQRVQLYTGFTKEMTEANDVSIMNQAATTDLRATEVWPIIKQVLAGGSPPSKLAEEAVGVLNTWAENGASLLGKSRPREAGAAVMDAVWTPIAETVLSPVLGEELLGEFASLSPPDNPPNSGGSSFGGGWYGYVSKDLRSELGQHVEGSYSREYCGNGNLEACSASLWAAIQKAIEPLAAAQGPSPSTWKAPKVRITFPPGLLPYTMRWTNRSTFQQVIEFTGHEEEGGGS